MSPAVLQTGVEISSTDCMSSGAIRSLNSPSCAAVSTVSTCWTRSKVSGSRSMYSSSTPSVNGGVEPKRWSSTLPPSAKPLPVIDAG